MHFSIPLLIMSLLYLLLILFMFLIKKTQKNIETKTYFLLLIVTIFGVILDISGIFAHLYLDESSFFRWLIVKLYLLFLLSFSLIITFYIIVIAKKENTTHQNKIQNFLIFSFVILALINFLLPFQYFKKGNIIYVYGANCIFLYGVVAINMIIWVITTFKYRTQINKKKIIPILTFIIFSIPVILIQLNNPQMLLVTTLSAFLVVFMYNTIENPDVRLLEQVSLAKDHAEKANAAKTEFLSSMSHEIRTPLNAIVGFSQAIQEETSLEAAKQDAKDIILASQNLLEIVNGILDISKIEANKMEIVNTDYDLKEECLNLIKLIKPRIGEKSIEIKYNIQEDIPKILYGDKGKIKEILTNILTNAVKYTDKGTIILNVGCINKNNECSLIISVEDTGRGIKPEKIEKLFTKFERLEEDKNTTIEGTGLGLAITKKLIELMGGKIVVQSVFGSGSKFTIYLKQRISRNQSIDTQSIITGKLDLIGKKILVVDDNELNIKIAEKLLKKYNITTDSCSNGEECISKIKNGNTYDLILMDDMMPKMSGTETLHLLKENHRFKTKVVVLTANAIEGMKDKYIEEGFDGYLPKPLDKQELEKTLRKFLNNEKQHVSFEPLPDDFFEISDTAVMRINDKIKEESVE